MSTLIEKKQPLISPILKWVGGKRQLLKELVSMLPNDFAKYYEPFVGGGALLFHLQPNNAVLNDSNEELINVYEVIRDAPDELINLLKIHEKNNCADYYYRIRELDRNSNDFSKLSKVERAARIIYLNKTCYNGLFRVNQAGQFNTPYGRYNNPNIVNSTTIKALNGYLNKKGIQIYCGDYKDILKNIRGSRAFVYLDPPYYPISNSSSFTGYTQGGFGEKEQIELKEECDKLNKKGIRFLLSNSSCDFIHNLYKDYNIKIIPAKRSINADATKRGAVDEVLISNYD